MRPVLALSLLVAWAGSAHAQPGEPPPGGPTPPPVDPPPADPPPPPPVAPPPGAAPAIVAQPPNDAAPAGYPLELVKRPLVLPAGGVEGGVELRWRRSAFNDDSISYVSAEPRVRASLPGVEVEGRVGIGLYQTEPSTLGSTLEIERFASVAVLARARLGDDTAIGAEGVAFAPASDNPSYLARAVATTKYHLSAHSAVELDAFAGAQITNVPNLMGGIERRTFPLGGGELRVQAQLNQQLAMVGRGSLTLQKTLFSGVGDERYFVVGSYGVRAVAAVSPGVDLIAGIDALNGQYSVLEMTVGVVARRVP